MQKYTCPCCGCNAYVYAHMGDILKAKNCVEKYIKDSMDSRPFEPYLNEQLLPILEQF